MVGSGRVGSSATRSKHIGKASHIGKINYHDAKIDFEFVSAVINLPLKNQEPHFSFPVETLCGPHGHAGPFRPPREVRNLYFRVYQMITHGRRENVYGYFVFSYASPLEKREKNSKERSIRPASRWCIKCQYLL